MFVVKLFWFFSPMKTLTHYMRVEVAMSNVPVFRSLLRELLHV